MPWLAAAGAVGGGIAGAISAGEAREQSRKAYEQSIADYQAIGIPSVEAQKIVLQQYKQQGKLTPELEESLSQGDSQYKGISTDPRLKDAQMNALGSLEGIGKSGGLTLDDLAKQDKLMGNIDADQRGKREAIMQHAQSRGGYGQGSALAAELMAQQNGATQAHDVGLQTAGNAQRRALDAISGAGSLGTSMQGQEFGQKAQAASAQDAINQWNAKNSAATQQRNVASQNTAQATNLANSQSIANANIDTANAQEKYNSGLQQKQFDNQLSLTSGKANARAGQATNLTKIGQQTAEGWANAGKGAGQAYQGYIDDQKLDKDKLDK